MKAEEVAYRRHSLKEIRERILSEDNVMEKLAVFIKSHPIYNKTMLESTVRVFYRFSEKVPNLILVQNCFIFNF